MTGLFFLSFILLCVSSKFIVHEWGTYTSVQGSNGKNLAGLHHGEERLPEFVHSRADTFTHEMWEKLNKESQTYMQKRSLDGIVPPTETVEELKKGINCGFCKVMDWIPTYGTEREVTQKLETPVIYFYSPSQINTVNVTVKFPKGIVTEVYPQTTLNLPEVGKVESVANGQAEWKVTVQDRKQFYSVPPVEEKSIWAPSRRVNSNLVTNNILNENEKHIFYRGVGRFDGQLSVKSNYTHLLVTNNGDFIRSAWVLKRKGDKGFIRRLPKLASQSTVTIELSELSGATQNQDLEMIEHFNSLENYLLAASVNVEVGLVKAGLFTLEARAMVDTWSSSYFKTEGLRILYVASKDYPDQLLPWNIQPTPDEEKRVLVGRVEVLLKSDEDILRHTMTEVLGHYQLLNQETRKISLLLKDINLFPSKVIDSYNYIWSLGRFAEAKIRRVLEGSNVFERSIIEEWILAALTY